LRADWSDRLLAHLTPDYAYRLLEAAVVSGGAVSIDVDGRRPPFAHISVDGLSWSKLERTYHQMHATCMIDCHIGHP
jgi:hypothetical protein